VSGIKTNLGLHKKAAGRLPKCWRQRSPCWRHNVVMWALTKHSPNRVASGEASRTMCFGYSAALKPHDQVSCMCRYDARQRVSPACVPPLPHGAESCATTSETRIFQRPFCCDAL